MAERGAGEEGSRAARPSATAIAVGLLLAVCVVGILDHDLWNPHEHRAARDVPLAGVYLGKTFLGSLSFETGRRILDLEGPEALAAYLAAQPEGLLLVRMKRWPFQQTPEEVAAHIVAEVPIAGADEIAVLRPALELEVGVRRPIRRGPTLPETVCSAGSER
ncbi:MAG: hypothetical protein JXQ29_11570 [Planctomycetes bacterium]|nr:hypothetical protein [Planctomycetota bacterium]